MGKDLVLEDHEASDRKPKSVFLLAHLLHRLLCSVSLGVRQTASTAFGEEAFKRGFDCGSDAGV